MKVNTKLPLNEYLSKDRHVTERMLSRDHEYAILNLPYKENKFCSKEIIKMTNVNIRYGNRTILKDINWVVFNGEKWALCGKMVQENLPYSVSSVPITHKVTPVTLHYLINNVVMVRVYGT